MKPGRDEPWDTLSVDTGVICSRCTPKEAFGFYPTDHEGAGDILRANCGRALIFGDKTTTRSILG